MYWIKYLLIAFLFCMSSCASNKAHKSSSEPTTMLDIYSKSVGQAKTDVAAFIENNLQEQKTFGYVKPYIPVVNEPVVRKVWVPDHKVLDNSDVMIAGHWVYVMIKPASWFIDDRTVDTRFPFIVPTKGDPNTNQKLNRGKKDYVDQNETVRENI